MVRHNIGDKVIALNDTPDEFCQSRTKNEIYDVLDISYCTKCGEQSINIDTLFLENSTCECECGHIINNIKYWTHSKYFANISNLYNINKESNENKCDNTTTLNNLKI